MIHLNDIVVVADFALDLLGRASAAFIFAVAAIFVVDAFFIRRDSRLRRLDGGEKCSKSRWR